MRQQKIYDSVEKRVREEGIMEKKHSIEPIPEDERVFSSSEEMDIYEMISDLMDVEEIISTIKQW